MIGIIITGHNHFASGIYSSITMVGGEQQNVVVVDFEDGKSDEQLLEDIEAAITSLNNCDQIVCCCDLMGGSPFKESCIAASSRDNVKVIYGINLGMMLEFVLSKEFVEDLDPYLDGLVETGKSVIGKYVYEEYTQAEVTDGI